MNILYVSDSVPYDGIRHAGGKTLNFYIKHLANSNIHNIKVVAFCKKEEIPQFDCDKYGIDCHYIITKGGFITNLKRVCIDLLGKIIRAKSNNLPYYKLKKLIQKVKSIKETGFTPDVVVLEWTNMVMTINDIRKIFPKSLFVASEHDVGFQGLERKLAVTFSKKRKKLIKEYELFKSKELEALFSCDVVMPQSIKDKDILVQNGVSESKIHVLTPYYHDMSHIKREGVNHDILFWGAMYRPENYEAAIWFIDEVMPRLTDTDVRFVVAGNRPPQVLCNKKSDRVIITGFVKDEIPLFGHSLCLVSPLRTGAGIKVKIIEALSSGIPILTNQIGIEGIPAKNEESYFHCEQPEEYARIIRKLISEDFDASRLLVYERAVVAEFFDLQNSAIEYEKMLRGLADRKRKLNGPI